MSPSPRTIDELIGVYNADGGLAGELRYALGKVFGRAHSALCDITHRGLNRRTEFSQACDRIDAPFELVHLNERSDAVRLASGDVAPCVLARVGNELVMLLDPPDLEACGSAVEEFERRLRAAVAAADLALG